MAATGCSGLARLSSYAREAEQQQNDERLQRKNYRALKNALRSGLKNTGQDALTRKYGEPLSVNVDSGVRTLLYRDGFGVCSEKIYIRLDESLNVSSYDIVQPCTKP